MPDLMATNNKTSVIIAVPACLIYGPPAAEAAAAMCLSTLLLCFSYIPCYSSAESSKTTVWTLNGSVAQRCYSQRLVKRLVNTDHYIFKSLLLLILYINSVFLYWQKLRVFNTKLLFFQKVLSTDIRCKATLKVDDNLIRNVSWKSMKQRRLSIFSEYVLWNIMKCNKMDMSTSIQTIK